ncbi:MAG: hypothetical protein AB7Y46_00400 [Armatimonadota bacterium]
MLLAAALLFLATHRLLAQPAPVPLSWGGTIQGYFITPEGELGIHELVLRGDRPPPEEPQLHPLWAGYLVQLRLFMFQDVRAIKVTGTQSGEVLYDQQFDPPRQAPVVHLRTDGEYYCHARHGLSYRVEVTCADGRTATAVASVGDAHLLPIPELRIDWTDLVRIREVRRWLREAGDRLLPGLRADDVPFVLEGEDGQVVLVGWPSPPEGFRPYEGPAPLSERIWVGQAQEGAFASIQDVGGYAGEFFGAHSVLMPLQPQWWRTDSRDGGLDRSATILHEICHVTEWNRTSGTGGVLGIPCLEARVLEEAARRLLTEPNARADGYPLVYQYLAVMEERDRLLADIPVARAQWRKLETSEAYAYYVTWLGRAVLEDQVDESLIGGERCLWCPMAPASIERGLVDTMSRRCLGRGDALAWWLGAYAPYQGFREATMLYRIDPQGVRRAWSRSADIRDELAAASGYAELSPDTKRRIRYVVKEATGYRERLAAYRAQVTAGTAAILSRFGRPDGPGPTPVLLRAERPVRAGAPRLENPEPEFLIGFGLGISDDFGLELECPALASFRLADGGWVLEVRTLLEEVSVLREHVNGAPLEVDREEVRLYAASARVTDDGGVLVVTLGSGDGE